MTRIVGVALLRNEDRFIAWSLMNAADFCDEIVVLDNGSTDRTGAIVDAIAARHPHVQVQSVPDAYDTHRFVAPLAGSDAWVLGVDGDEIYDRDGLARLRPAILAGDYDRWWKIHGHTLHAVRADFDRARAQGYAPPAARSITKLYNFRAISSWEQGRHERLHGKAMAFRPGWSADSLLQTWTGADWDATPLRCLHLCFFPRSSAPEAAAVARSNPAEIMKRRRPLRRLRDALLGALRRKRTTRRCTIRPGRCPPSRWRGSARPATGWATGPTSTHTRQRPAPCWPKASISHKPPEQQERP